MPDWRILITDGLEPVGKDLLRQAAFVDDRDGISSDELLRLIGDYSALIVRGRTKVTREILAAGKILKIVGRSGVGVDNIDLQAAKATGIVVVNAPLSTSIAVAELTCGMMLALARAIPNADSGMKSGQWLKKQLHGLELSGKVLGVIGMGNIGRNVAARAAAFGMNILGYDPFLPADSIAQHGVLPSSLSELYARSDFITLHIPLTKETHKMINRESLQEMKSGVRLICTARGGIIDEDALIEALDSGRVAGAALDVFAQEPPGLSALVIHPSVIATPHIGAQTAEAQERAAVDIAHEVLAGLRDEPLRWRVV